jgi:hypothetical protein
MTEYGQYMKHAVLEVELAEYCYLILLNLLRILRHKLFRDIVTN